MDSRAPYTPAQLRQARGGLPRRGLLCHVCGLRVPQFAALDARSRRRVIRLVNEKRPVMAALELRDATGCPDRWALLWVLHKGRPRGRRPGPPCRCCRLPLSDSRAARCRACGATHLRIAADHPDFQRLAVDPSASCYPTAAPGWLSRASSP